MTAPDPAPTDARRAEDRSARIAVTVFPLLVLAAALVGFLAPTAAKTLLPQVNPVSYTHLTLPTNREV